MGRLAGRMPLTHITFLIACLAIAGIPPFSGFFSKDEILTACFRYSPAIGWTMTGIAALTAFYMFRLYCRIFWGKASQETEHAHESPAVMTLPLLILAALTCVMGWVPFGTFISADGTPYEIHLDMQVALTSIAFAIVAIALALTFYLNGRSTVPTRIEKACPKLHQAAYRRFYFDEMWQFVTHRIIFGCLSTPIAWFDRHVIDRFMDFMAWSANAAGEELQPLQNGRIQTYMILFLGGIVALTIILLLAAEGMF